MGLIDLWPFKGALLVGEEGLSTVGLLLLTLIQVFIGFSKGRVALAHSPFLGSSSPALLVSPQLPLHCFLFCLLKTISLLPLVALAQTPKLDSSWRLHPLSPTVLPSFLLISASLKSCLWLSFPMSLSFFLSFFFLYPCFLVGDRWNYRLNSVCPKAMLKS